MPRQLTRHDAAKLKRVIDALAFDDETFIQWDQQRAARKAAVVVQANLLRLWVSAPHVAARARVRGDAAEHHEAPR